MTRALSRCALALSLAVWLGCGSNVTVSVSPETFTLQLGGQLTFVALVTGTADRRVTWSIDEGDLGGTITQDGLFVANAAGEFHVRATSVADPKKSGVATVTVVTPPPVEVTVSPSTATVMPGARQTFAAFVSGTNNKSVSWRVEEANGGTVSVGGTYTAPATEGTYHLVAQSDADPSRSARATITVTSSPAISVAVMPDTVTASRLQSISFSALVSGTTNTQVTWSLGDSCADCTINATTGLYRASNTPGTYYVTATSAADPSKTATATIVIPTPGGVTVTVSPSSATVAAGSTRQFYASVSGTTNTAVTWGIVEGAAGGSITPTGLYTAPDTPGSYRVFAASQADPSRRGYANVVVTNPNIVVQVSPTTATVAPNQSTTFTATVTGTANTAVTWSVMETGGGTVQPTGANTATYTAPANSGTYRVMARSAADPSKSATATVTVQPGLLSGNITYAGAQTGRIYVVARDSAGRPLAGTSLTAPGSYSLRGIDTTGTVTVRAFMDVTGTGTDNASTNPSASGSATWSASGATVDLRLTDAAAQTVPQAATPQVYPGDASALVVWPPVQSSAGVEIPDQYVIYWSTTPNPSSTNMVGSRTVAALRGGVAHVTGLTNGTAYYFAVAGFSKGTSGPVSAGSAAVTIGQPSGTATATGYVSSSGFITRGPLYVLASSPTGVRHFVRYATPTSSTYFTLPGLTANATYQITAFMDMAGEDVLSTTDPRTFDAPLSATLTAGSNYLGTATLANNAAGRATSLYARQGAQSWYEIELDLRASTKLPVRASVSSSTCSIGVPSVDLPLVQETPGRHAVSLRTSTQPTPTSCYITVTYSDNTTGSIYAPLQGVVTSFATAVTPTGSTTSQTPTFTWSAPASPPISYTQNLVVTSQAGAVLWRYTGMPSNQTSVAYNADGSASPATLSAGSYVWAIEVQDQYGNRSATLTSFSVQ